MNHTCSSYFKILFLLFLSAAPLKADILNLTGAESAPNIAEIYIADKNIRINLEIAVSDLAVFKELIPDEWTKDKAIKRPTKEQRLIDFSNKTFQIIADGKILQAHINIAEARLREDRVSKYAGTINPYTNRLVKGAPDDKRVLYVQLDYELSKKPEVIEIIPPLDENGYIKATIGFVAYHESVPVIDFRYLSKASKVSLNWNDPWYTKFENKGLTRHYKNALMIYLYAEPRRVRVESLMRVDDISKMTSFKSVTNKEELLLLKKHVKEYFKNDTNLMINTNHVSVDHIKVDYFKVTISGLKLVEDLRYDDKNALFLGVSHQYYVQKLPDTIESKWPYFNENMQNIPFVSVDPAGPYPEFIYPEAPVFKWTNYIVDKSEPEIIDVSVKTGTLWKLPVLGDTKVWGTLANEEQSKEIVQKSLENVRVAFIEQEGKRFEVAFSKLTLSKQNSILAKEFTKLYAPSVARGGVGKLKAIRAIEIKNIRALDASNGFSTTVSAIAEVEAQHWGHSDKLLLKFEMLLDVVEKNDYWLISDVSILDLKDLKN